MTEATAIGIKWDKYPDVLRPKHIQEIMGRSQRKTYEFLHDAPFHVAKDGRELFVSKAVFRRWLEGTDG
jgi:alkyl sulfatase BDS1-like metallo-beta-lactamase superfamily hydrolase